MCPDLFAAHQCILCFPALLQFIQISLVEMASGEILSVAAIALVGLLLAPAPAALTTQGPAMMQMVPQMHAVVGCSKLLLSAVAAFVHLAGRIGSATLATEGSSVMQVVM